MLRAGLSALIWSATLTVSATAQKFPPDTLKNLKVFPPETTPQELVGVMRTFALGLGVRCHFCHVGEEEQPFEEYDFPSDEKPTKRKAREMLKMVQTINQQHLASLDDRLDPPVTVTCETCHHGVSQPRRIQDILTTAARQGGPDSAVATYRRLRQEYYGSAAYDFAPFMLDGLSFDLIRSAAQSGIRGPALADNRDMAGAIAFLNLNLEFTPRSANSHFGLGEAYRILADTARAISHYERALELNPDLPPAAAQLRRLRP